MRKYVIAFTVLVLSSGFTPSLWAQSVVKVGALYPLSGNAAAQGQAMKVAIEVGEDIVNDAHPEMSNLPLAATKGLPNLGGAKVEVVFADNQGNPSVGQNETLRLITQQNVAAMIGAYQSSVALTATAVAERYGIPFLVGDSVAPNITGRGFQWVFRTTPIAPDFSRTYMEFLDDMNKAGHAVHTIAIVNENTDYGTSVAEVLRKVAAEHHFDVVADIAYNANTPDVSAEVLQLKQKNPDVVVFVSYASDAILYMKTMKQLGYKPKLVLGDDAGFSDPSFLKSVGAIAQGAINRSSWDIGKPGSTTYKINEMFKARTGRDMDDTSGRTLEGFLVLTDAINRAGSTQPAAIQKALRETNLTPQQLMMGFKGVRFDKTGQNILASNYLVQLQGDHYTLVWPTSPGSSPIQWPYKGWE